MSVPAEGESIYGPRAKPDYAIDAETGCWNWLKGTNKPGYPWGYAHRRYYERAKGEIPAGYHVHHRCRNRRCLNPDHLEARDPRSHWTEHAHEKRVLTVQEGHQIRELVREGKLTYEEIGRRFGVSYQLVYEVAAGKRSSYLVDEAVELPPRECATCGEPIVGRRRQARYCSSECQRTRPYTLTPEQRARANERQRRYYAEGRSYRHGKKAA